MRWDYEKVLLTSFYDILATLKLQKQLGEVTERIRDLQEADAEQNRKNKRT